MNLHESDRDVYSWQLDVPGMGATGQAKLRSATALVSRVGGLGGPLAFSLAAAGFGKIILAHAGSLRPDDLNRQILMTHGGLGKPRAEQAAETLRRFNPGVEVDAVAENIDRDNVKELVGRADIVFDAAPLFEERFLMNREAVRQGKPLVDAAMFCMEGRVLTVVPGKTACLACLYPEVPPEWRRRFPVIGAVAAMIANLAAIEGIKLVAGLPGSRAGELIHVDAGSMEMRRIRIARRPDCGVCG